MNKNDVTETDWLKSFLVENRVISGSYFVSSKYISPKEPDIAILNKLALEGLLTSEEVEEEDGKFVKFDLTHAGVKMAKKCLNGYEYSSNSSLNYINDNTVSVPSYYNNHKFLKFLKEQGIKIQYSLL